MSKLLESSESIGDEYLIEIKETPNKEVDEKVEKILKSTGRNYIRNFRGTGKEEINGYKLKDLKRICRENYIRQSYFGKIFRAKVLYYVLVYNGIIKNGTLPKLEEEELKLIVELRMLHEGPPVTKW